MFIQKSYQANCIQSIRAKFFHNLMLIYNLLCYKSRTFQLIKNLFKIGIFINLNNIGTFTATANIFLNKKFRIFLYKTFEILKITIYCIKPSSVKKISEYPVTNIFMSQKFQAGSLIAYAVMSAPYNSAYKRFLLGMRFIIKLKIKIIFRPITVSS